MLIYITRHGQPDIQENTQAPEGDPPLTPLGRRQARRLGERLKQMGFAGRILSSPYHRTAETADLIAEVLGTHFYPEPMMREFTNPQTIRRFQGMSLEQLRREFAHVAEDAKLAHPWWSLDRVERESQEELTERVQPLIDEVKAGDADVLLVGHGASIGGCIEALFEWETFKAMRNGQRNWNCALTAVRTTPALEPLMVFDATHLPPEMTTANRVTLAAHQQQM